MMRFHSSGMHRVSFSSSVSLESGRPEFRIKRTGAVLRKAFREKHSKWQGKTWRQSKEQRHEARSSHDMWRSTSSDARWTEVTEEMDHLKTAIHERQTTWSKSLKETAKREGDILKALETAAEDEKEENRDRSVLEEIGRQLRVEEEEADESRNLLKDMQKNLEAAADRAETTRSRLNRALDNHMRKWNCEKGRFGFLPTREWRMSRSNHTKLLNLGNDFDEMSDATRNMEGKNVSDDTRFWRQQESATQ